MEISEEPNFYLYNKLGAYETDLAILQEFFPDGDTFRDPLASSPDYMSWILSETGYCFICLGLLEMAEQFLERANFILLNITMDWHNASRSYQNLSDLYASQGDLDQSTEAARNALNLSIHAEDKTYECYSNAHLAFAEHLRGNLVAASEDFKKAEILEQEINHTIYLLSFRGIQHADHLIRIGNPVYAREVTKVNLAISEVDQWLNIISRCHRVLGDLDVNDGDHNNARKHYYEALKIARQIAYRQVLIEALLARGKWAAKHLKIAREAFTDLEEALNYATSSGFRIIEADIRVALAWAHITAGNKEKAKAEAIYAKQMSKEMGYYWGNIDADEVLAEIEKA